MTASCASGGKDGCEHAVSPKSAKMKLCGRNDGRCMAENSLICRDIKQVD
jgi:hypothetical protein